MPEIDAKALGAIAGTVVSAVHSSSVAAASELASVAVNSQIRCRTLTN